MATDDMMPRSEALREALGRTRKGVMPTALLLSLEETRRRLGIGKTTLYRQMKEEKIAYVKIGRRRLISVKAMEQFIEQRENRKTEVLGGRMDQTSENVKPDMLTVQEVCEKLRISRWAVNKLIRSKQLASVKIGSRRLVPQHSLEAYERRLEGKEGG